MLWPRTNAGSNLSHSNTLMTTWMHRMCKKWCTSWYAVICCRPAMVTLASLYPIIWWYPMNYHRFAWSWQGKNWAKSNQTSDRLDITMNDTHTTNGVDVGQCLISSRYRHGAGVTSWYRLGHHSHHPIQEVANWVGCNFQQGTYQRFNLYFFPKIVKKMDTLK